MPSSVLLKSREDLLLLGRANLPALVDFTLQLQHQLLTLQTRLAQNSRNSSKPPSTDGYTKPAPKSLRQSRGRKPGGQPNHRGHALLLVDNPDKTFLSLLTLCPCGCGADLSQDPVYDVQRRQVFDLPPLKRCVTEYQAQGKRCPRSGKLVYANFPPEITATVQYGPGLQQFLLYARTVQFIAWRRLTQMCQDLFGLPVSEQMIQDVLQVCAHNLQPFETALIQGLLASPILHADETGLRVAGKLHWLHVYGTTLLTFYAVHPKRGPLAMNELGILPRYHGRLIHDGLYAYFAYLCSHGLCNAHHLRELTFLYEELHQLWAGQMIELLTDMLQFVQEQQPLRSSPAPDQLQHWLDRYQLLLAQGRLENPPLPAPATPQRGRRKQSKAKNLLDRLKHHQRAVLAFLYDFAVPFTNNQAEQDARMVKVQQKISGCFRTLAGAQTFARLRSYISTARKHGLNVYVALGDALAGTPFIPSTARVAAETLKPTTPAPA